VKLIDFVDKHLIDFVHLVKVIITILNLNNFLFSQIFGFFFGLCH
jgi:hypothetical protein